MFNPRDASRLYYLRRHLQLARSRGVLNTWEYLAAIDFLLDREEEALRSGDGKVPFHYERAAFIRAGLRVLEGHQILSPEAVQKALALPIGEEAALTPIFEEAPAAGAPEAGFALLCPHCEAALAPGVTVCAACGKSILTQE